MAVKPEQNPSFIGSIQGEVSAEASPMLQFLIDHARAIFAGVVLFILIIIGYWFYSASQEAKIVERRLEFGRLVTTNKGADLVTALEKYLQTAPQETKASAYIALAEAAKTTNDYPRLYEAWKQLGTIEPNLKITAALAMSQALIHQDKKQEALAELEGVVNTASGVDMVMVNSSIVAVAESIGNFARALTAAEAILADPAVSADTQFWTHRAAALKKKIQSAQ